MEAEAYERARREGMKLYGFGPDAMKQVQVCSRCGTMMSVKARSCSVCRAKLPRSSLFQIYKNRHRCCKNCDTVVQNGVIYCPVCGKKI